ncbi:MAG: molybdopterin-dependent oxidoreductase [Eggerthellales bacterium]|nr:molybdopterin-dependent oxidoreductase [Eggerthellales bacterium]
MSVNSNEKTVSRRKFVQGTFATAAAVGAGSALFGCSSGDTDQGGEPAAEPVNEEIHWCQCNVNCGGSCVFQWHSIDGKIQYMESDNTGDADFQARACLRGRSMRRWVNHEQRLLYPMKRVGKRGEGKFQQISWDEAIETIGSEMKRIYETYGAAATNFQYASGMQSGNGRNPLRRLMGLMGGWLGGRYDYSTHMMSAAMPYMFGSGYSAYDNVNASSFSEAAKNSDLVVMFGNSPAETRMGGASPVWDFVKVREGVESRGGKIIQIDYRLNETASGHADEWVPIRSGTDAALVAGIAHEWIANGQVDKEFLDTYCVGYDDDTMPESAKGQGKSYKDYVMGTGADGTEKTPEWAAQITGVPAAKIRELAETIAAAQAPFIVQGWGPQRHTNGEETARAISVLPCLIGKIGLPGTNTGQREAEPAIYLVGSIPFQNPCEVSIPVYEWLNAVDHGADMTPANSDVRGADNLENGIKLIVNYGGNCLTNQHSDINKVHEILSDESKCEFIVVVDTVMTDSARYADILLPDAMRAEVNEVRSQGYGDYIISVSVGTPAQEAPGECRNIYDVCTDLAEYLGIKDEFTEGKTYDEWIQGIFESNGAADAGFDLPDYETMKTQGIFKAEHPSAIGLEAFRNDPVANPLGTPSGKIEIYSETLDALNDTWELEPGEKIYALPEYHAGFQGYGEATEEFPLYGTSFHHKSRIHSSYGFIEDLEQVARQRAWINTETAKGYGVANGDQIFVTSPAGKMRIEAYVTDRIVPGTVAIPQGAWHQADMYNGDKTDTGGCVNTLSTYHPTPLAKGNGAGNTFICQIQKA